MPHICGQVCHRSISHSTSAKQQLIEAFAADLKGLTGISPILCSHTKFSLIFNTRCCKAIGDGYHSALQDARTCTLETQQLGVAPLAPPCLIRVQVQRAGDKAEFCCR